jgi:hypothetical protein
MPVAAGWAITMLFVLAGWVLFRSSSFSSAASMLQSLAGFNGIGGAFNGGWIIAISAAVSVLVPSAHEIKDRWAKPSLIGMTALALLALACVLEAGNGPPVNFIYFQF